MIDKLIGNAAEDMMPEICESKGDMAYLADVTDEFDARKFNLSGIFAAFHTFPRSFDMKRSSYVFSDLLEGRYEGLTFAVVNTDIRQGWTSAGQNASARLFTGFLLRIQSPRPFAGRIPLRPSAGDNTSGVDDAAFDPDWVGTFFDVGPEDIEKGLETILEGKDFNAVLYGNEFLLAVETHERLFWPRGNHTVDGTRRKLQRDADIAIRIIDLLGWHGDTCDLDWWQPSWTRLHATREVVRQAGEQRQHADNARQVESDRLAAIIENADGTFSVGSRTYKSRSSAEAYLDLIERTQKWAETE